MHKKLTISVNEDVYEALHSVIGRGSISQFIEALVRPIVLNADLEKAYKAMAEDEQSEAEAMDWAESLIGDIPDETW